MGAGGCTTDIQYGCTVRSLVHLFPDEILPRHFFFSHPSLVMLVIRL